MKSVGFCFRCVMVYVIYYNKNIYYDREGGGYEIALFKKDVSRI